MTLSFQFPRPAAKRHCVRAFVVALALVLASIAPAAEPAKRSFNVPASGAEKALKVFSEQARLEVLFPTAIVSGVRTRSVAGEFPPREALDLMLTGTGLVAVQDEKTGALSVRAGAVETGRKKAEADPSRAARPIGPTDGAKSAAAVATEAAVELSPFVVSSATDRGYQAFNTLAGTRLNSKLEDLGSSITVVTMQQMEDTAALDLNDIFRYEASTEGTANFTQFTANRTGGVGDDISLDPARANRIRGVGNAGVAGSGVNLAFGNNAINSKIPVDLYNIDALEISRGPNSNLFGLGASAGTVNLVPSLANLNRTTSSVSIRFDDWGGHRETLNLNRPLIAGKLALRVAAVHEGKGFIRQPSSERIDRVYGTITAQPFRNTTVRASVERYNNFYRRPNSLMPRDTAEDWRAAGSPSWDPTTQLVTLGNGTKVGPFAANQDAALPVGLGTATAGIIAFVENNTVQFLSPNSIGNRITTGTPSPYSTSNVRYLATTTSLTRNKSTLFPLFFDIAVRDKSLYDWTSINYVAPNNGEDKAATYSAGIEHTFIHNPQHHLAVRAGFFRQDFTRNTHTFIDVNTNIAIDPNEKLLDGRANPYFKRPFIQPGNTFTTRAPDVSDTQTADLAYQWTPAKLPRWLSWIGRQTIGSHAEVVRNDSAIYRSTTNFSDDHAWTNRANRTLSAGFIHRFYIGDNAGQNVDYAPSPVENINGTYNLYWYNNLTGQWVNEPATIATLPFTGSSRNQSQIRTINATAQSAFFRDRLVTTFGWRRDRRRERASSSNSVDPTTGLATFDALRNWGPWTDDQGSEIRASQRGDTKTWGAVAKPLTWLHFHYNQSDSFFPQPVVYRLDLTGTLPNPHGEGKDYGVTFNALQNKLSLRINRFNVTEYGSRGSEAGTIGNRVFRLEGRVKNNGTRDEESFLLWAENLARTRLVAQGITNPAPAQLRPAIARIMGVTDQWLNIFLDSGQGNPATDGSTDVNSHGYEVEATYNPTPNWRIKFTGAQAVALDQAISPEMWDYLQNRLPVWTTARGDLVPGSGDGKGALWWTSPATNNRPTAEVSYIDGLLSPYLVAAANVGKPRTQVRKYRWAALTNYAFTEGWLKNFNVGGALRWEDKASIGFGGKPPTTSGSYAGAIIELDPNKPYWDRARFYADLSAGYRFRMFGDKVRGRVQLNIRDAFESGRLQKVAVNPNGSAYAVRIIDPRQFILTTTFDL